MTVSENDLIEGRNALKRTGHEIQQAAKYCSGNYLTASTNGQRRAIDGTMNYATQSLGTMIHHINNLASSFLVLLDERTEKLSEVEEKISQLSMEVKIRQEKVARKAIGSCTTSKAPVKFTLQKIRQEPPTEYVRRPIDYSLLDHIGHGTRTQETVTSPYGAPAVVQAQTLTRRGSATTHHMMGGMQGAMVNPKTMTLKLGGEYAATSVPPSDYQTGTMGRTAGIYRVGGMVGQYSNPYAGAQQQQQGSTPQPMLVPIGRSGGGGGGGGYATNTVAMAGGPTGHRSGNSSGSQSRAPPVGYTPTGMHMVQAQQQSQQPQHHSNPPSAGYASKQQMFTGDQCSPGHEQMPLPPQQQQMAYARQQSEPVPAMQVEQQQHHYPPSQYRQPQQSSSLQRGVDVNKQSIQMGANELPPPPANEMPIGMRPQMQSNVIQKQQHQYSQQSGNSNASPAGAVDLSRLQPSPMDQLRPRQPNDPAWAPHHYIQKVVTVYEYMADKSDELTFGENELIYVVKKNDDGWWEGVMMNGQTGLFPGNYVEVIE